jgi:shikimate kinase
MKIFIIGYRCTGKTTTGKSLSSLLDYDFVDTDERVEISSGMSIPQIVKQSGWDEFRQMEQESLFKTGDKENAVVSTGGGIILDSDNRNFIKGNGFCAWLWADAFTVVKRIQNDIKSVTLRPTLTGNGLMKETKQMLTLREPYYSCLSQLKIDTILQSPFQAAELIKRSVSNVR